MGLFIPGIPRPQGSKRHVGNGRLIEASKYLPEWRNTVREALIRDWEDETFPFKYQAVSVRLLFRLPKPKVTANDMPVTRPDIDKLARAVLDAMTGPIIADDSQVVRLLVTKCYDLNPGVVVDVSQSGNFWPDTHDNA